MARLVGGDKKGNTILKGSILIHLTLKTIQWISNVSHEQHFHHLDFTLVIYAISQ